MKNIKKVLDLMNSYKVFGFKIAFFQIVSDIIKYLIYSNKIRGENKLNIFFAKLIKIKDKYVQRWIESNFNPLLNEFDENHFNVKTAKKIIWTMWLQGIDQMPEIVRLCNQSVEINKGEYQHIILTNNNLTNYIEIPEYIFDKWKKGIISNAHFSDYVRIYVLEKYGGIWLDATVLLNHPFSDKTIENYPQYHAKGIKSFNNDFLYFESYNWESYFLARFGESNIYLFLKKALEMYWKRYNKEVDYLFLNHLAFLARSNSKVIKKEYEIIPLNNSEIENVYSLLSEPITDIKYQNIINGGTTNMFKLNHRHEFSSVKDGQETVYAYLKRIYKVVRKGE